MKLFGTDGIRGNAGTFPLDARTVEVVGASLGRRLADKTGRKPTVVIGRDTRESGEWIEQALTAGLITAGAKTRSAGVITTPGVAFLCRRLPADAGVVISASHNVFSDNGIKVFAPTGRKLDDETERQIEADVFAAKNEIASVTRSEAVGPKETEDLKARYLDYLADEVGASLELNGLSLVLDCANGAAFGIAADLFQRLGAQVTTINATPDGRNINLNCGSLHMESLQATVKEKSAALGVAFDGDADRALFVDAEGRLVNGDATLWVLAGYLQDRNALDDNVVVATVMSNIGLELALQSRSIQLVRTDVGDKYVLEELLRRNASLGGEQSGHIIFPRLSLAGDGLITTLAVLRAMKESGKDLHELTRGFQSFPQVLLNVPVERKPAFANVPEIQSTADEVERILGSEGRLLLRYSGTEPLARVMIEGKDQRQIEQLASQLALVIKQAIGS